MSQPQLFQHDNTALAVTLATCGVPFWCGTDGLPRPVVNIYDRDILRGFKGPDAKPLYEGWPLEKAALHAWKHGRRGLVIYNFQSTPDCQKIVKEFKRHSQRIVSADADAAAAGALGQAMSMPPVPIEVMAQICCQFTKNRNVFAEGWRTAVPYLAINGETRTEVEGGRTFSVGSFRLVSLNASPLLRQKVGM